MINQLLSDLGFSEKEIAVYLCILKNGKVTPANIARLTKINRTTVYAVAKELLKRGVVAEDLASKTGHLLALPPSDLSQLAIREEQALAKKRETIAKAVDELEELTKEVRYSIPKVTFVTEEDLSSYLYKQTPVWNKEIASSDGIWWGFQDHSLVEQYQEWIGDYWKRPDSAGVSLRILSNQSEIEQDMRERGYQQRNIRFWKGSSEFTSSIWVNGSYIVMIYTRNRPHYLVEIHDKFMAQNLRGLFKGIWETMQS